MTKEKLTRDEKIRAHETPVDYPALGVFGASRQVTDEQIAHILGELWDDGYSSPSTYNDVDCKTDAEKKSVRDGAVAHSLKAFRALLSAPPAEKNTIVYGTAAMFLDPVDGTLKPSTPPAAETPDVCKVCEAPPGMHNIGCSVHIKHVLSTMPIIEPAANQEAKLVASNWPQGWRFVEKKTCYSIVHGNECIANLVGPDAEENAKIIARCLATPQEQAPAPENRHLDEIAVYEFADAMTAKMAEARTKGRSGWQNCSPADLSAMLHEHVEKGDPRDVANFCMMLWHHEAPITNIVLPAAETPSGELSDPQWKEMADGAREEGFASAEEVSAEIARFKSAASQEAKPVAADYDKSALNSFVQDEWDRRWKGGKHGHYETLFGVVHAAIRKIAAAPQEQAPAVDRDAEIVAKE